MALPLFWRRTVRFRFSGGAEPRQRHSIYTSMQDLWKPHSGSLLHYLPECFLLGTSVGVRELLVHALLTSCGLRHSMTAGGMSQARKLLAFRVMAKEGMATDSHYLEGDIL